MRSYQLTHSRETPSQVALGSSVLASTFDSRFIQ